ncbi:hypothetical protein CVD25_21580 [Bacillus canaveralius]|uniref:Uncharacterized protein n=1 Tax=Bacillus canaveralius TaxID=1403243 RepID=A0A2N5GH48_9BACI|nr:MULTISPECIES: aspartyl-phosphate phosphatase Spo0E family protein [Bacillus]PLR80088.1 hypothetical protein CU635_19730 [Bacillus canaveralius]PLR80717.1 hypothetical protein CVD23_20370 [Bacillus sp. V33-4]PLR89117.1 hypothetical protein CVD25_21580 [Bacillus canaveralius]RSK44976.1 aspartyl-phosphate phosphatase Spo0E family protein [Bacillus canaveralius]
MCPHTLLRDIEFCRKEMVELAAHSSLSNRKVLEVSTKLDRLLNRYYILTAKK